MNETAKAFKTTNAEPRLVQGSHPTFILPFIVASFLALPSLLVLAFTKQTVGLDLLNVDGLYSITRVVLWVLVPVAVLSGVLYMWRGESRLAKTAVIVLSLVLLASFAYVIAP
jgi:hypothetical protein